MWSRFDSDPQALAWARERVQHRIERAERFAVESKENKDFWRKHARMMQNDFIGGEGCVIAAFDERRPAFVKMWEGYHDE
jgi:hypothetical protein